MLTIFALNNTLCKIKLCQTVVEKFSFSELKIEKVFNVRGSLASCLTFRLFLTLDLYPCGPLSLFKKMVVLVHDTHLTIHDPTMNYANMSFYEEINRDIKGSEKK